MSVDELASDLLASPRFTREYAVAARLQVVKDLLGVNTDTATADWSFLLSCASVMSMSNVEEALDAALRIAQAAFLATDADEMHRDAAVLLLDRAGNQPALQLAIRRNWIAGAEALADYPAPLRMEIIRTRLELSIPATDGTSTPVSKFQRALWSAVIQGGWTSASAPTSAGKSFIIRRWFTECARRALLTDSSVTLVIVVPTRALVEEVSRELAHELPREISVRTLPFSEGNTDDLANVYVLTQERLHLLQQRNSALAVDLLFIDEAHKFNDGARGVLLHSVLDEAVRRRPGCQVIFASPLAEDPEVLLDGAPVQARQSTVDSHAVTVSQNLLYANQVPRDTRSWVLDLVTPGGVSRLGGFQLADRPTPQSKRLPFVAVALGSGGGNLVYADGAAAAEDAAALIYEALGPDSDMTHDQDVAALIELVQKTINPSYGLVRTLRRGVAFHYGNMPQLVRSSIEDLFKAEKIRFLVCTSTLLEGVNLPCRSIFVRGPHRGRGKQMTAADFWNLAGRAGRWGTEFEGNIICVDTTDEARWPDVPRSRVRQRLRRQAADLLADPAALIDHIAAERVGTFGSREMEAVYSFLASRISSGVDIAQIPGISLTTDGAALISSVVRECLTHVRLSSKTLNRHAGISPLLMQALLLDMSKQPASRLLLAPPEERGAWRAYADAFGMLHDSMGAEFGVSGRQRQLAILVVQWMQGYPLARLIQSRLEYQATLAKPEKVPVTIRSVMDDVENVARFRAPKYLACYRDVLSHHLIEIGRGDLLATLPEDIEMLLELGVSTRTELSLMELGLSRTSAVELFSIIANDSFTPTQVLSWLSEYPPAELQVPELVRREIQRAIERQG